MGQYGRIEYLLMEKDTPTGPENANPVQAPVQAEEPPTDWASLRAQAEKLGISLSELQQKEREKKARLARKNRSNVPA